jgi:hypothetical protein
VNCHDEIPVGILHVLEADIAENAGVVDENIDAAKVLDSGIDDLFAKLDAVVVGNSIASGLFDLFDDDISSLI